MFFARPQRNTGHQEFHDPRMKFLAFIHWMLQDKPLAVLTKTEYINEKTDEVNVCYDEVGYDVPEEVYFYRSHSFTRGHRYHWLADEWVISKAEFIMFIQRYTRAPVERCVEIKQEVVYCAAYTSRGLLQAVKTDIEDQFAFELDWLRECSHIPQPLLPHNPTIVPRERIDHAFIDVSNLIPRVTGPVWQDVPEVITKQQRIDKALLNFKKRKRI